MEHTQYGTAYTAPDRGTCAECGGSYPLQLMTGYLRRHDGCPGGGRPPAKTKDVEDVQLPDPT